MAKKMKGKSGRKGNSKKSSTGSIIKKYLRENWGILTSIVLILVLIIIITVFSVKTKRLEREMFEEHLAMQEELNEIHNMPDEPSNTKSKKRLVLCHARWCGHCKKLMPEWKKVKQSNLVDSRGLPVDVVDYEADDNKEAIKKYNVQGFPTILLEDSATNAEPIPYNGQRNADDIIDFCSKN